MSKRKVRTLTLLLRPPTEGRFTAREASRWLRRRLGGYAQLIKDLNEQNVLACDCSTALGSAWLLLDDIETNG